MEYENHIFISYARGEFWTEWVNKQFVPRLRAYLENQTGSLKVFVDKEIQPGANFDYLLKRNVARSMIMIPLLSPHYFSRVWCRTELALMLERERFIGLEGQGNNYGLIITVRLGDGDMFPDLIGHIQYLDFEDCAILRFPENSLIAQRFDEKLISLAKIVATTLPNVPHWDDRWEKLTCTDLLPQLTPKKLTTSTPPRLIV